MLNKLKLELIAKNVSTKRLSFRSLNDIRGFRHRSTKSLIGFKTFIGSRRLPLRSYEHKLKMLAIHFVVKQVLNQLKILRNINNSQLGKYLYVNCPKRIFSWSHEDWFLTLPYRLMWYNLLNRQMPQAVFHRWLTSKKLKAFENCFKTICRTYARGTKTATDAMQPFIKFHNLEDAAKAELKKSAQISRDIKNKVLNVENIRKGWTSIQAKPEDAFLIAKIEYKYILDYSKVKEEEVSYRNQLAEERLKQEIHQYKRRMSTEDFASSCTKDCYFNEIASLRERINKMTKLYDKEYSRLDGDITFLKAALEKLHLNHTYLLENIQWFKTIRDSVFSGHRVDIDQPPRKISFKQIPRQSRGNTKNRNNIRRSDSILSTKAYARKSLLPRTKARKGSSIKSNTYQE